MQLWDFFIGTRARVRNSHGERAISVRATEVLLYCFFGYKMEDFHSNLPSKTIIQNKDPSYKMDLDFLIVLEETNLDVCPEKKIRIRHTFFSLSLCYWNGPPVCVNALCLRNDIRVVNTFITAMYGVMNYSLLMPVLVAFYAKLNEIQK